jgi:hypothetical protein
VDDLYYLDEQLYRSLMQLKLHANQGGDVESLELFFEVCVTSFSSGFDGSDGMRGVVSSDK